MLRRSFLTLVLVLGALGARAAESDIYNPMVVGLRWNVDIEVETHGNKLQGTAVREITGSEQLKGQSWFVVRTTFTGIPRMEDFAMYRRKSPSGIFAINPLDKEKQEYLEMALPLSVGATWKTTIFTMVTANKVESKESVTVNGKTYDNCLKVNYVSQSGNGPSGTYYLAPDIGNVLETMSMNASTYKFSLKSFSGLK